MIKKFRAVSAPLNAMELVSALNSLILSHFICLLSNDRIRPEGNLLLKIAVIFTLKESRLLDT